MGRLGRKQGARELGLLKTKLDCYSCLVRQALQASRFAGMDDEGQRRLMNRALYELQNLNGSSTPPETVNTLYAAIAEETGGMDLFREVKARSTREALALYPDLKKLIKNAENPFETAVRLAIAGNIIDFAASGTYNLKESVRRLLHEPLTENDVPALKKEIDKASWVLYIADNAGETVFDRLLIEEIAACKQVVYVVRGGPILNDATIEDAFAAGIEKVAQVKTTGYRGLGVIFKHSSQDFLKLWEEAPVIIAKGMANYETLSDQGSRVFFLLQVKCDAIGEDVGQPTGSLIVRRGQSPARSRRSCLHPAGWLGSPA